MNKISIILPVYNQLLDFIELLPHISNQTLLPDELIIIDSSDNSLIKEYLTEKYFPFSVSYYDRQDFQIEKTINAFQNNNFSWHFNKTHYINRRNKRLYPAEAVNFGALKSKNELIAMLDVCTIPNENWLRAYSDLISTSKLDIVFGSTLYASKTNFQDLVKSSTFGNLPVESNPGSLLKKNIILQNPLKEGVRAGADIEWRPRIKKKYKFISPSKSFLVYSSLPTNLFSAIKKFFIYQIHASRIRVQLGYKDLFLSLTLIFATLILFKWNTYMGWFLFLPNVLKVFLISCNIFLIMLMLIKRFGKRHFQDIGLGFTERTFKYLVLVTLFFISYRWNSFFASWIEDSSLYIPHITKIYVISLVLIALIYRGLIFPFKNGYSIKSLLPFKFILIGFTGVILDLSKLPGFILGSFISLIGVIIVNERSD